jgi:hypothetical protein
VSGDMLVIFLRVSDAASKDQTRQSIIGDGAAAGNTAF